MKANLFIALGFVSTAAFAISTDPCYNYDPEMSKQKYEYSCQVLETLEGDTSELADVLQLSEKVGLHGEASDAAMTFQTDFYGEEIKKSVYVQKSSESSPGLMQFFGGEKARASAIAVVLHAKPYFSENPKKPYGYFEKAVISTDGRLGINEAYLTIDGLMVEGVVAGDQAKLNQAGFGKWKHLPKAKYLVKCRPVLDAR